MIAVARVTDLTDCHALRRAVFMEEQQISAEEEWDDLDAGAWHYLARADGRPIGSARVLLAGDAGTITRVCVLAEARGQGAGAALMRAAIDGLRTGGYARARLGAQVHAIGFYERLGFVAEGDEFLDAGIPHRWMDMAL